MTPEEMPNEWPIKLVVVRPDHPALSCPYCQEIDDTAFASNPPGLKPVCVCPMHDPNWDAASH